MQSMGSTLTTYAINGIYSGHVATNGIYSDDVAINGIRSDYVETNGIDYGHVAINWIGRTMAINGIGLTRDVSRQSG